MKYLGKIMMAQQKWLTLTAAFVAILGVCSITVWASLSGPRVPLDTSTLTLDAWGCVAITPADETLKQTLKGFD